MDWYCKLSHWRKRWISHEKAYPANVIYHKLTVFWLFRRNSFISGYKVSVSKATKLQSRCLRYYQISLANKFQCHRLWNSFVDICKVTVTSGYEVPMSLFIQFLYPWIRSSHILKSLFHRLWNLGVRCIMYKYYSYHILKNLLQQV